MADSTTITLPKDMPLADQVEEVNRQISEWINSLDEPFNDEMDVFQLSKCEQDGENCKYHYIIARDAKSPKRKR